MTDPAAHPRTDSESVHDDMSTGSSGFCLWLVAVMLSLVAIVVANRPSYIHQSQLATVAALPFGAVIAVADLHGDLQKARQALQLVSVVDEQGTWVARNVTVVQLGDLVDRGPDSLPLLQYMHHLQDQAGLHGSRLELLLGNHEFLNLHGDYRYVSPVELVQLGQQSAQPPAVGSSSQQHPEQAAAAYLAGLEVWKRVWQHASPTAAPAWQSHDNQQPDNSSGKAAGASNPAARDGVRPSQVPGPLARATGIGSIVQDAEAIVEAVAARHQLLSVVGQGTPCATAFTHAGLLPHVLEELLLLATSGTHSYGTATPKPVLQQEHKERHQQQQHELQQQQQQQSALHDTGSQCSVNKHRTRHCEHTGTASVAGVITANKLQQINSLTAKAIRGCTGHACTTQPPPVQRLWSLLGSEHGPVWLRRQAQGPEASICGAVHKVLLQLGVHRLVVGHTPQRGGKARAKCDGRLLLLDTGMSVGMMGSQAAAWICHASGDDKAGTAGHGYSAAANSRIASSSVHGSSSSSHVQAGDAKPGAAELGQVLQQPGPATDAGGDAGGARQGPEQHHIAKQHIAKVVYADGTAWHSSIS